MKINRQNRQNVKNEGKFPEFVENDLEKQKKLPAWMKDEITRIQMEKVKEDYSTDNFNTDLKLNIDQKSEKNDDDESEDEDVEDWKIQARKLSEEAQNIGRFDFLV